MKVEILNLLKCVAIFFIGLAVATETGKFLGIAAVIALIACIYDKDRFSNLKSKVFNNTIILFLVYVGTIMLIAVVQNNWYGLRMIMRDFEKIVSFLIIYLLIGNVKGAFCYGAIGAMVGYFIGEMSVFYDLVYGNSQFGNRYGGIYGHPNGLGSVLELAIPFFVFLAYYFKNNKYIFPLAIFMIVCAVPCLYFSGSRGAMMAVGSQLVVLVGIYCFRKYKIKSWKTYIFGIITILTIGIMSFASLYERSYDSERILLWISSWKMFLDYPIFGIGFGNWSEYYKAAYISPLAKEPNLPHPHNLYLYLLAETGIVGFTAYLTMILGQLKIAYRHSNFMFGDNGKYLNIADMFVVVIFGLLVHNLVDVSAIFRYVLLIYFFYWGLCCLEFKKYER